MKARRETLNCQPGCCKTGRPDSCYWNWNCRCHPEQRVKDFKELTDWEWNQRLAEHRRTTARNRLDRE